MTVIATYRNGAFIPQSAVSLPEGAQVEVLLPDDRTAKARATMAAFDARYPGAIGTMSHEEAAELQRLIGDAFEHVENERDC